MGAPAAMRWAPFSLSAYRAGDLNMKTAGQIAYEADVMNQPRYHDGTQRKPWRDLQPFARWTWERNPTPRATPTIIDGRCRVVHA